MKYNVSDMRDLWNRLLLSQKIEVCCEELNGCGILDVKVLKLIYQNPDYRIKDILKLLNIPNSTMTNVINRLEKKELLTRRLNNNNLRSFELELTEKGRVSILKHLEAEVIVFENMLSCLDESEKDLFINLFGKIVDSFIPD